MLTNEQRKAANRRYYQKHNDAIISHKQEYREDHPDIVKATYKKYHESITVEKRCPVCRRHFKVRKDYKVRTCPHCGAKLRITKHLNDTGAAIHGLKVRPL
jgi:ribosomal protein L37AE/L43A